MFVSLTLQYVASVFVFAVLAKDPLDIFMLRSVDSVANILKLGA
jgi:hypothetical protein